VAHPHDARADLASLDQLEVTVWSARLEAARRLAAKGLAGCYQRKLAFILIRRIGW